MNMRWIGVVCGLVLMTGCASKTPQRVFLENTPLDGQGVVGARPVVLFPDYFLIDGFELQEHGHIPSTGLVGAGMTTSLDLAAARTRFSDLLHYHQWSTDKLEMGPQSFRVIASHEGESVEIRGVRGTSGPTHIFLLYSPPAP